MRKLLAYPLSVIHYLVFGLLLVLFHPMQWLALKTGGYAAHKKVVDRLNFLVVCSYYLLGNRVTFRFSQPLPLQRPIIFVANHQSMYDIPPMIWYLRKYHAKFISKIELTRGIPSISFNLKYGGGANIDRKDRKQALLEIAKLGTRMEQHKWSAVIFPEGTRSRTGALKPFAVGGIATLLKKVPGALLVPIAIENSWKMVRWGKFPLGIGENLKWTVLEPLETAGKDAEELIKAAELQIADLLQASC